MRALAKQFVPHSHGGTDVKPWVGWSAMIRRGSFESSRAKISFCRLPPESWRAEGIRAGRGTWNCASSVSAEREPRGAEAPPRQKR